MTIAQIWVINVVTMKKKISILFGIFFITGSLFLVKKTEAMIPSNESEMTIHCFDLENAKDLIEVQQIGLRGIKPLQFGTHIMGAKSNSQFKIESIPEADLFLGGVAEARNYRGLVESGFFLKNLDNINLKDENFISKLELLSKEDPFKVILTKGLQEVFMEVLENFKKSGALNSQDLVIFENWKIAVRENIRHHLKSMDDLNINISKPLLIINVAKEDAPSFMTLMSEVPVSFFRSEDDISLFLGNPFIWKIRSVFAPWVDSSSFDLSKNIDRLSEIIISAQKLGYTVFVHCHYGVSRSASLVINYLMTYSSEDILTKFEGESLFERVFFGVASLRNEINPNPGFLEFLKNRHK